MSTNETSLRRRTLIAALLLTLFATGTFVVITKGYERFGTRLLSRLDLSIGEVLMKEGMRYQEAGAEENAKERFTSALSSRFAGEQNRVYTLKLLGTLYWNEGNYEKALPLLDEAVKSPKAEPTFFEPYCDTLFQLKRYDEAARAVEQWQQAVAKHDDHAAMSAAKYHEGRIALAQGHRDAAKHAFEEGTLLSPGGRNAAELAGIAFEDKDYQTALEQADACLTSGASGARAEEMRALKAKLQALSARP